MNILPQSTTQPTTTSRDEQRMARSAVYFAMMVEKIEAQQKRLEAARKATAEFLGYDDGDIIFA